MSSSKLLFQRHCNSLLPLRAHHKGSNLVRYYSNTANTRTTSHFARFSNRGFHYGSGIPSSGISTTMHPWKTVPLSEMRVRSYASVPRKDPSSENTSPPSKCCSGSKSMEQEKSSTQCASEKSGCSSSQISVEPDQYSLTFWKDSALWKKASFNTLNCLVGCSIGDMGTMMLFQIFFPTVSMWIVVPISMMNGIATSIALETVILKVKSKFPSWRDALRVAIRMSLVSMITMELAENFTDLFLWNYLGMNQGSAYWISMMCGLVAGFFTPLPYNYFMLKKYRKSCH